MSYREKQEEEEKLEKEEEKNFPTVRKNDLRKGE